VFILPVPVQVNKGGAAVAAEVFCYIGGVVLVERYLDLLRAVNYLEEVMGTAWLKESLKSLKGYAGGGGSFGRGIDFSSCGVSETAYYWYRAREELALYFIGGQGSGLYALQAAVLGDDLWALRESRGLLDRVEGLKQPADAGHVVAELVIAAGYARHGRRVVFAAGRFGAFEVMGAKINVSLVCDRCRGNGHSAGNPQGTAVIYRYQTKQSLKSKYDHDDAEPGGKNCAGNGAPVVQCSFIARQGRRGPEMVRTGRLAEGHPLAADIYVPNEIIMPGRE